MSSTTRKVIRRAFWACLLHFVADQVAIGSPPITNLMQLLAMLLTCHEIECENANPLLCCLSWSAGNVLFMALVRIAWHWFETNLSWLFTCCHRGRWVLVGMQVHSDHSTAGLLPWFHKCPALSAIEYQPKIWRDLKSIYNDKMAECSSLC